MIQVNATLEKLRDVPLNHLRGLEYFVVDKFPPAADAVRQALRSREVGAEIKAPQLRCEFKDYESLRAAGLALQEFTAQLDAAIGAASRTTRDGLIASSNAIEEISEKLTEIAEGQPAPA